MQLLVLCQFKTYKVVYCWRPEQKKTAVMEGVYSRNFFRFMKIISLSIVNL